VNNELTRRFGAKHHANEVLIGNYHSQGSSYQPFSASQQLLGCDELFPPRQVRTRSGQSGWQADVLTSTHSCAFTTNHVLFLKHIVTIIVVAGIVACAIIDQKGCIVKPLLPKLLVVLFVNLRWVIERVEARMAGGLSGTNLVIKISVVIFVFQDGIPTSLQ
jgi:hypothetical protein